MPSITEPIPRSAGIQCSAPGGKHTEHWAQHGDVTAQDIFGALKSRPSRFVIVPRGFSQDEAYRFSVLRLNDPMMQRWSRPPEMYWLGEFGNIFYLADALLGEGTPVDCRNVLNALRGSDNADDRNTAEAIAAKLPPLDDADPETIHSVELNEPADWMKRVFAAQERLR